MGELVHVEGMLGDAELKMPREIGSGTFGLFCLKTAGENSLARVRGRGEEAERLPFCLEQDAREARIVGTEDTVTVVSWLR